MSMLNIHPDIDDPFYRYKMPKLIAKIEGSGNGIKTAIVNMSAIAKALNRSPEYTTKFFGCELGAQVQMYPKDDRWIVNGAHDGPKLQSLLSSFIKKFVICENCENPETKLIVNKNDISQKCLACGHVTHIPMVHRLATYIANHPPKSGNSTVSEKGEKKLAKRDKRQKQKQEKQNEDNLNSIDQNEEDQTGTNDDNEASWSVDVSEEAARQRIQNLTKGIEDLTVNPALVMSESDRADSLFRFVLDHLATLTDPETQTAIYSEAKKLALVEKAPLILSELLFSVNIVEEIEKYRNLLLKFCAGNQKAQRYLLGGIEKIVGIVLKDELIAKVPVIFMELYEKDLVEEDTFRHWADKPSKKYIKDKAIMETIHNNAQPFINWLEEAEEEEDDEPADDKDVDVIFTFRDEKAVLNEEIKDKGDDDGGIDIDAI